MNMFLQETMNPKDIMQDAIHNFHPQYQQYTQVRYDSQNFRLALSSEAVSSQLTYTMV